MPPFLIERGKTMIDLRPFSDNDWMAFGGADTFSDGTEPMIAINVDDYAVIVDDHGITFNLINDDGDVEAFSFECTKKVAGILCAAMPTVITPEELVNVYGFSNG